MEGAGRTGGSGGHVGRKRAWLWCAWAVPVGGGETWPGFEMTRRANQQHTRPHWCGGRRRAPEGLAAVPVGGGETWPGFEMTRRANQQHTRPHWCAGRRRAPEGLAAVPVGGGGAWPGFETTRRAKLAARTASGRAAAHGRTKQPGPAGHTEQPGPAGHTEQPGPAGRTHHNVRNWAASRPTARSARRAILKSPGPPQCRRRNAPRARQATPR